MHQQTADFSLHLAGVPCNNFLGAKHIISSTNNCAQPPETLLKTEAWFCCKHI